MPRRLIIGILVVLILGIVGGTIVLIVQQFRGDEVATPTPTPGGLTPAQPGSQQVTNPSGDDDADGLTNAEEVLWGTITGNVDSDGDGYKDGEEVAANHNPAIPAPNDKLPENFVPGQDVKPLDQAPLQVDQFFVDDLDLSGGRANLTEVYQRQFPEDQRTPDTLATFAKQQPIVITLPRPDEGGIKAQSADTPLVMGEYLDVAGDLGVFSNQSTIIEAINDVFSNGNTGLMAGLATRIRLHQQKLITIAVPPAAVPLHKLLLGYTEVLAATYTQITTYNEDPVKGLVGLNQLEKIDERYYPLIEREVDRLRAIETQLLSSSP